MSKVVLKKKLNQNEVLRLCQVLVDLNNDPHPGLITWNIACQQTIQKLANELVDDQSEETVDDPPEE